MGCGAGAILSARRGPPYVVRAMSEQMPPDDDPIIRSLREQGVRPLSPGAARRRPPPSNRRLLLGVVVVAILLLWLVPAIAGRLSDWLWYREIGHKPEQQ